MLSKKQFDILVCFSENLLGISKRNISKEIKLSIGSVYKNIRILNREGFVYKNKITEKGLNKLEEYRVKRIIITAAGFGARMLPLTLNSPKALIRVYGTRLIDTLLDAVYQAEIEEVYIVRGYLSEQFDQLLIKYPNIKFIDNKNYIEENSISSIIAAGNLIDNTYITDSDLYISNPKVITKYQYNSNYIGYFVDKTDDWCVKLKNGFISSMSIGGEHCYQILGISYWSRVDSKKLMKHIERVYNSLGGKQTVWDLVPLSINIKDFKISVRECDKSDLIEIDTYNELKEIDKAYEI